MNYLPKNRHKKNFSRKIIFIIGLFIAGAIVSSFFDNLLIKIASPLWHAENGFSRSLGKSVDFFRSRQTLIRENTALKDRVSSLEFEVSQLSLKRDEVDNLTSLLGRTVRRESIAASVLTHPPQSPYDLIVIDAGLYDGILIGARVTLPEGPEMGVVSEVFPTFSKVKLFSTGGEKTSAVLERHQMPVELEGMGGGNFKVVVPRETEVVVGDRILSASLSSSLVAVVEDVKVTPTDAFKEILAKSPANIFSIRYVSILK